MGSRRTYWWLPRPLVRVVLGLAASACGGENGEAPNSGDGTASEVAELVVHTHRARRNGPRYGPVADASGGPLPDSFSFYGMSEDMIWGVFTDSLGVQSVRLYTVSWS